MTSPADRFRRADRLLASCLEIDDAEQRERLLAAAGEDADIVAQVRRLLAGEPRARARIGDAAAPLAGELLDALDTYDEPDAAEPTPDVPAGSDIGPYRVVRELGRGGMGVVYLCERADDQFHRQVALKVVRRGLDTDEILARFQRERRILARLEHPGIARLYDAGATEAGRPFLVLEYVEGLPIDRFCDERRLDLEARIELFFRVCEAVSYAHRNLVLHRDLKPSNILVTEDGPRLLDFGVAKLLDDPSEGTRSLTRAKGPRLTPEYASPEQLRGDEATTASDIYALGLLLYELLTGVRPSSVGRGPGAGSGAAPPRPSTIFTTLGSGSRTATSATARSATPQRLARRLRGDLDTILLKALHEDPARRYGTVQAFAEDLRRHLDGFPVEARPDAWTYRVGKFVGRNRLGVFAGSGLSMATLLFAVGSLLQQAQTARERDRAEQERLRAEGVVRVLEDLFTGADFEAHERIDTLRVQAFLERSAERTLARSAGQPAVQASLLRILGGAQVKLAQLDRADTLLTQARSLLDSLGEEDSPEYRRILSRLGHLRLTQGRREDAAVLYARTLSEADPEAHVERSAAYQNLALATMQMGRLDEAAADADSAVALARRDPVGGKTELWNALSLRGGIAQQAGDLEDALPRVREAWELAHDELGSDHPLALAMLHNYAFVLGHAGRYEEAEARYLEVLDRYVESVGSETPGHVSALVNYGSLLRTMGRPQESLTPLFRADTLGTALLGADNPIRLPDLFALAQSLKAVGRSLDAARTFYRVWVIAIGSMGDAHPAVTGARRAVEEIASTPDPSATRRETQEIRAILKRMTTE
ncbi:MAG: serine/threonine-protein kinase [Gemmatimonadota bacterium]